MPAVLVDAGALIALLDPSDREHERCVLALRTIASSLVSVLPAVAEAMRLLSDTANGPDALCDLIEDRAVELASLDREDFPRIKELMRKYRDLPMDFANAALVRIAERDGLDHILSLDKHFRVYALPRRRRFVVLG